MLRASENLLLHKSNDNTIKIIKINRCLMGVLEEQEREEERIVG